MARTILDAMDDAKLFGREFAGSSWDGWRAFLAALFGLGLEGEALDVYEACTGRTDVPESPFTEAHVIVRATWRQVSHIGGRGRLPGVLP